MKTTLETRDSLREMAGTVAVKGPLLIELLDDIDQLGDALNEVREMLLSDSIEYDDMRQMDTIIRVALSTPAQRTGNDHG